MIINLGKKTDRTSGLQISALCGDARYSDILESVITNLGGVTVLRLNYESDYQGYVDIDVELKDGRVFTYEYSYGSCSGCDEWESRNLDDAQIKDVILKESTIFDSIDLYNEWRALVRDTYE